MITVENNDTRKYYIQSGGKRHFVGLGETLRLDTDTVTAVKAYSKFYALNIVVKAMLFLLCVLFVFLDTDYENNEFNLVSVKFRCIAKSNDLKLSFARSPLININKDGELKADFVVGKSLLIAHIISVCFYSVFVIAMLIGLAVFTTGEKISPFFYVMAGAAAALGMYLIFYTVKRYKKTLMYLKDYFDNYVY